MRVFFLCALLAVCVAGRSLNDDTAAPLNAQSTLAFNRNHMGTFFDSKVAQVTDVLPGLQEGSLMRSIWRQKKNDKEAIPPRPGAQSNERCKGARWAQYARRASGYFGTNGVEDPGRDKFPLDAPEDSRVGCSRHHVCPNAVIGSFWARLMSLTNEQRGAVKGFLDENGFVVTMSAKFPDLTKVRPHGAITLARARIPRHALLVPLPP